MQTKKGGLVNNRPPFLRLLLISGKRSQPVLRQKDRSSTSVACASSLNQESNYCRDRECSIAADQAYGSCYDSALHDTHSDPCLHYVHKQQYPGRKESKEELEKLS